MPRARRQTGLLAPPQTQAGTVGAKPVSRPDRLCLTTTQRHVLWNLMAATGSPFHTTGSEGSATRHNGATGFSMIPFATGTSHARSVGQVQGFLDQ